ncbi:hypothetical protein T4A_14462 [Trichinella pseudospiralis]|uniref:Uncharacterized protein n=1 Tax=Trichinella pseudospiralis TaxID=6337 RepID=A0A0V1EJH8_TRIPS|nr:hypothetical protein T4A_14462 [Trichinella pseudospiralis]
MSWRTRFGARNAGRDSKDRCCCRMCPLREGVVLIGAWKVIEFFFGSISLLSGYLHGGITPVWLAVGFLFETFLLTCTLMLFVGLRRRIAVLLLPFLVLQILILISMFIIVMYSVWLLQGERSPLDEEMEVDNIFTNYARARLLSRNDEMHIVAKMNFKEFCYKGSNKSRLIFMNYLKTRYTVVHMNFVIRQWLIAQRIHGSDEYFGCSEILISGSPLKDISSKSSTTVEFTHLLRLC